MFSRPRQFRTRVYHAPEEADAAPASPETGLLVFWSFHSSDERASEGFVYANEIGGSYCFSKPVTPRIGWREALDFMAACEAEAEEKLLPVDERAYTNFVRLHRNDFYERAVPYGEHPLLKLEQEQSSLYEKTDDIPKLARRPKPPAAGGP